MAHAGAGMQVTFMTTDLRKIQFGMIVFAFGLWCIGIGLRALSMDAAGRFLFDEDMLVETATAIAFLLVFLVASARMLQARAASFWLIVCGAFGLLIALEEFDYFRLILHWEAYDIWGVRFDGIHDIPSILKSGFATDATSASIASAVLLALCVAGVWIARRAQTRTGPPDISSPELKLLIQAIAFIVIAQIIDLHIGVLNRILPVENTLEESLEVTAALIVLIFVSRYRRTATAKGHALST